MAWAVICATYCLEYPGFSHRFPGRPHDLCHGSWGVGGSSKTGPAIK